MDTFILERASDAIGKSGTGIIAKGAVMPSGRVVMEWTTKVGSLVTHNSIDDLMAIHCSGMDTILHWT